MTSIPDRMSVDKWSPYFGGGLLRYVGVKLDGVARKTDVHEYDRVAGWVDIRERNEKGQYRIASGRFDIKRLHGVVEPFWEKEPPVPAAQRAADVAHNAILAAADKRARKMAKRADEAARATAAGQ